MRTFVAIALLLAFAAPAQAKQKPLTAKQAFAVLGAAADDVTGRGEEVINGGCRKPAGNRADCGLTLKRAGNHGSLSGGPDTCSLSVTVTKRAAKFFYRLNYATGTHMEFAC
jgi:hypothetical protein